MSEDKQVYVEIYRFVDGEIARRMGPMSESKADRAERGALINMNRDEWGTRQVSKPTKMTKR